MSKQWTKAEQDAYDPCGDNDNAAESEGFKAFGAEGEDRDPLTPWMLSELRAAPPPRMFVPGLISEGIAALYAQFGRGKSLLLQELAAAKSSGAKFYGADIGGAGRVLYICSEGGAGALGARLDRIIAARRLDASVIEENLLCIVNPCDLTKCNAAAAKEIIYHAPGPWELIMVDTLSDNATAELDDNAVMGDVVRNVKELRRLANARVVVLAHHPGKDESRGMRGGSALANACDSILHMTRDDSIPGAPSILRVEKFRDAPVPREGRAYVLKDGLLEEDAHAPTTAAAAGRFKDDGRAQGLLALLVELSKPGPVLVEALRQAMHDAALTDGNTQSKSKQWTRALERLLKDGDGQLAHRRGPYIIPGPAPAGDDFSEAP